MSDAGPHMAVDVTGKSSKRDWQNFGPIKKRAAHLLANPDEIPFDVSFRVGKEEVQTFSTHRLLMALGSPAFHAMLYGPLKEKGEFITVTDVTCDAFWNILRYMYSDDLTGLSMANVMDTLYAAKKYLIPELCHACRVFVQENMHPLDACRVYSQAANLDEEKILALALGLMCSCSDIIMQSTKSLELDENIMQTLLSQPDVSCTELQLWLLVQGCWSVRKCALRIFHHDFIVLFAHKTHPGIGPCPRGEISMENSLQSAMEKVFDHLPLLTFFFAWATCRLNGMTDGAMVRQEMGDLLKLVRFPLFTLPELVNGPMEHETLLAVEIASLLHWTYADKKREMTFVTDKRGEARQKPYIATIKVYSEYSAELSLDVWIELRADVAPTDCSVLRKVLDQGWTSIGFVGSAVEITPPKHRNHMFPVDWAEDGLSFSPGVLWMSEDDSGYKSILVTDTELEYNWTDDGVCGRVVNWTELESLIKGPFAHSLRYKLEGYSERFPVQNAGDEETPG